MAAKAGPKHAVTKKLPVCADAVEFIELVTGTPAYAWQREVLLDLTAEDRPRVAYVQIARKQGKSRLGAALMLAEACMKQGRHIFAIADSERNLNSVLMREIRDIISASEHLRDCVHVFKNHIEVPETGSTIETRASNFRASQGINPHLVVFDEVHLQRSDDIWSGMQMAGAAREDALLLGITTPGYDLTSHAHSLYQAVKAGDSKIYGKIYEPADPDCDLDDRAAWEQANPTLTEDPATAERFLGTLEFDRESLPEHEFRRFRLGMWTATSEAWLPYGAWDALAAPAQQIPEGTRIWAGFDGSYSGDSTALVGVTDEQHVFVIGLWENPGRQGWRVPRAEVEDAVHMMFARYDVQSMLCDPPYWVAEIQSWIARYGETRVIEFPTHVRARMAPACTNFYSAVLEGKLSHSGDPALARHVSNAIVKDSPQGSYITKPDAKSPAKIDAAVAAVIAYDQAVAALSRPTRPPIFVL